MVLFTLLLQAYPIIGWLEQAVASSSILAWLAMLLGFVQTMLPEVLHTDALYIALHHL